MNEQDIYNEYDTWLNKLSKYVISRSSGLLSTETLKNGRILLFASALSTLLFIGIITITEYSVSETKIEFKSAELAFISIELICLYYAITFSIDAYGELKIWHFKTLIKNSDDEQPLNNLRREHEAIVQKGKDICDKYSLMEVEAEKSLGLDIPARDMPDINDRKELRKYTDEMEARLGRQMELNEHVKLLRAAQDYELRQLDILREILLFKIESLKKVLPFVKKICHFKRYINIVFPLISFFISIGAYVFHLLKR